MSSFCWCILNVEKGFKEQFISDYNEGNIWCFFDKNYNHFLKTQLKQEEVFCNIACGYEDIPCFIRRTILNNDELFFGYAFPSTQKRINEREFVNAQNELKMRLYNFQTVVSEICNMTGVCGLRLFFTETANETSLSEYLPMSWTINEISDKMFDLLNTNLGILPAFTVKLTQEQI